MKILVLLPDRRRWPWHDRLVAKLEGHEVTVGRVPSRPYPTALRLWLGLEKLRSVDEALAAEGSSAARADLVLDLSEQDRPVGDATLLRPLYDGSVDTLNLVGRLLRRQCPLLEIADGSGTVVASSYAAVEDKQVFGNGLAQAFARVETLLLRAVAQGCRPLSPPPDRPERRPAPYSLPLLARRALRRLAGKLRNRGERRTVRSGHWNIAVRPGDRGPDISSFDLKDYLPLPPDPSCYYADPFVIEDEGRHFLFAEAYPYDLGKGVIVCAELGADGTATPFRTVLERPYHLSYPTVVRREGGHFLIPEASASKALEIYRARTFPNEWVLERRLLEGLALVDPTVFEHGDRLWLFATMIDEAGSGWDELFAWHAPALAGPWTPHRLNPIKSDCRGARPGGRPIRVEGRLLRPAQRCERSYGESLVWFEVTELTPERFAERWIAEWRSTDPRISGIHTADLGTGLEAVDFRSALEV